MYYSVKRNFKVINIVIFDNLNGKNIITSNITIYLAFGEKYFRSNILSNLLF